MLIDSHCHIHDANYEWNPEDVIKQSIELGVQKFITIGTSAEDSAKAAKFSEAHENVWWTFGYHPNEFNGDKTKLEQELKAAKELFASKKMAGIGEIGLDYHFEPFDKAAQIFLLENMLQIAQDLKKPVSFHVRDAYDDFWPIFDNFRLVPSVLHSFSDSEKNLEEGLKRGMFVGVNGLSTFANIPHPPLERLIFETDAPYLTPKPFRGKINVPGYIKYIAEWAAEYYKINIETIAEQSTANTEKVFNI